MTMYHNEDTDNLLRFLDLEAGSIEQALRHMAERQEADAQELRERPDAAKYRQLIALTEESAKAWRDKAEEFRRLYDRLPHEDY